MKNKIVVVDVGCRWGFADDFLENPEDFLIYGFDPDPEECNRLNALYNVKNITAIPVGLGLSSGKKTLYQTREPACSSLYRPDPYLTKNYPAFHCEVEVGQVEIETTNLDDWAKKEGVPYIDHLKIDTQGSELDILKGGQNILDTVRSIQVEVEFNPMYLDQCLFHQVDEFLRRHDFVLWKFTEVTHYSKNKTGGRAIHTCDVRYDEHHSETHKVYSGQLFWANAHYVRRDVISEHVSADKREKDCILFSALGMPDVIGLDEEWDRSIVAAISKNSSRAQHLDDRFLQAAAKAQQAETKAQQAETKAQQAETVSNERLAQIQAIYASRSWKITRPLRGIKRLLKGDFTVLGSLTVAAKLKAKRMLRPAIADAIIYVNTRPALRDRLKRLVSYFPWLRQRLVRVAMNSHENSQASFAAQQAVPLGLQNMTPRARRIYQDLKTAIENKNKGVV